MLVLSRKEMQQIQIGEGIVVTVLHVKGQVVRLGIDAPPSVKILRSELSFEPPATAGEQAADPALEMAGHI